MTDADDGKKKKQLFRAIKLKPNAKPGRGNTSDPNVICDALCDNWDEFKQLLDALPEEEKDALRLHFNSLVDDEDDLGDTLFGDDADDAQTRFKQLGEAELEKFATELTEKGVIDKDALAS